MGSPAGSEELAWYVKASFTGTLSPDGLADLCDEHGFVGDFVDGAGFMGGGFVLWFEVAASTFDLAFAQVGAKLALLPMRPAWVRLEDDASFNARQAVKLGLTPGITHEEADRVLTERWAREEDDRG